jgi:hypothetical protein
MNLKWWFRWITPILRLGSSQPLDHKDMYALEDEDAASTNFQTLREG